MNTLPPNPSDNERYATLKAGLALVGRSGDFNNIIELLNPPPPISEYATLGKYNKTIGIIGGGIAGMTAAYELRKLGCNITIFDALTDRIGGRVYTYYFDQAKKLYAELGAVRIPVGHQTTWYYINNFGLNTVEFVNNNPQSLIYANEIRVRNTDSQIQQSLYPTFNLTPQEMATPYSLLEFNAFNTYLNALSPEVRKEILSILPRYSPEYLKLIDINIRTNFESLGLSEGAIEMITSVRSALSSILYQSYDELLADAYPANFSGYYQIVGGMSNLPYAFYKALMQPSENCFLPELGKVSWCAGTNITGIYQNKYLNKVGLQYVNSISPNPQCAEFDYVVCAIPFSTLQALDIRPFFSNLKMQAIQEINYVNSQKSLLLCNQRFWEENTCYGNIYGGISYTDLLINYLIYPSNDAKEIPNPYRPGVLTSSYTFNQYASRLAALPQNLYLNTVLRQTEQVQGLAPYSINKYLLDYKLYDWGTQPSFRAAFSLYNPSQKRLFSSTLLEPEYNNKVYFAGEHMSATHGWMQGSLYTAKKIANEIATKIAQ